MNRGNNLNKSSLFIYMCAIEPLEGIIFHQRRKLGTNWKIWKSYPKNVFIAENVTEEESWRYGSFYKRG